MIIDDGYIDDKSEYTHSQIRKKEMVLQQIEKAGMQLVDEIILDKDDIKASDTYIFEQINKRCKELIKKYPDKRTLFEDYLKEQEEENEMLETKVVCSTMVISKK